MSLLLGWRTPRRRTERWCDYSHRSPKGNGNMRRLLNQAANAAARTKGSIFEIVYRRSVPRLAHNQAIGAIAHRQCRLIWLILHQGVHYEERGPAVTKQSKQRRTARMIRQLRNLGYRIESPNPQPSKHKLSDFRAMLRWLLCQQRFSSVFRAGAPGAASACVLGVLL